MRLSCKDLGYDKPLYCRLRRRLKARLLRKALDLDDDSSQQGIDAPLSKSLAPLFSNKWGFQSEPDLHDQFKLARVVCILRIRAPRTRRIRRRVQQLARRKDRRAKGGVEPRLELRVVEQVCSLRRKIDGIPLPHFE